MFAAMNGNVELIKILIGFGAELDAKDTVYGMEYIVFYKTMFWVKDRVDSSQKQNIVGS